MDFLLTSSISPQALGLKLSGYHRCPFCITHFTNDAHMTCDWVFMREYDETTRSYTLNEAGKKYAKLKSMISFRLSSKQPQNKTCLLLDYPDGHHFGVDHPTLFHFTLDRIFVYLLHMQIRIAEKIIKEVGRTYFNKTTKEKSGRKTIGAEAALKGLNAIMVKHHMPTFAEDDRTNSLKLNKFMTGDDLRHLDGEITSLLADLNATKEDINTWGTFSKAMKLAKTWEKGNGLFAVDGKTKQNLKKACSEFFQAFRKNTIFGGKVTPYVHIFCSHVPALLDRTTNLQRFTQQGAEHWMGMLQRLFLSQTNHQLGKIPDASTGVVSNGLTRLFKMATALKVLPKYYPTPFARKTTRSDKGKARLNRLLERTPKVPTRITSTTRTKITKTK